MSALLFSPDGRVLAAAAAEARGQPPPLRFYRAPPLDETDREPAAPKP